MSSDDETARRIERLNLAARRLHAKAGKPAAPFILAFLTDVARVRDPLAIASTLPAGASVILRDYDAPDRAALAKRLAAVARARDLIFLVGADPALAEKAGADGLHLKSSQLASFRMAEVPVISAACHSPAELRLAEKTGAQIALLSPVFPTRSHPGAPALGPGKFREIAARSPLPVLALGGVDAENAGELAGTNVAGIAAIGAFASSN